MIRKRRCKAEGCPEQFIPRTQRKDQKYCSKPECQQKRKNKWQREKRRTDKDYRANDVAARENWAEKNPGYSRLYREKNPEYVERNRLQQRERNKRRSVKSVPERETAGVRDSSDTDWQLMELAGKKYQVRELVGGRMPRGNRMGDKGQSVLDRNELIAKEDVWRGKTHWETTERALFGSVRT
ncbi:MAG: hypothetical protein GY807_06160 [Gammaproteobacteria bacterium]|nr:hypothetical protein [Gammaproteobacteria bacterium]